MGTATLSVAVGRGRPPATPPPGFAGVDYGRPGRPAEVRVGEVVDAVAAEVRAAAAEDALGLDRAVALDPVDRRSRVAVPGAVAVAVGLGRVAQHSAVAPFDGRGGG